MKKKIIKCPSCEKLAEWSENNPWRPFCCERCRLIDLGAWADESHRIASATSNDFAEYPEANNDKLH